MTLTHQLSSSTNLSLYGSPSTSSPVLGTVGSGSQVELLEEQAGLICSFIKVQTDVGVGYLENTSLTYSPIEAKYQTAPSICPTTKTNFSYIEPEWFTLTDEQPYLNEKTLEYCVCITANNYSINRINDSSILEAGIKAIFKFYNKPYNQETLDTYKNYYLFASIKDYYLSYRPFQRSKYLISIPIKYLDAIDDNQAIARDISDANYVFKISIKDVDKYFTNLKNTLLIYRDNIFFANTTVKIKNPLLEGLDFISAENSLKNDLDMQQKIDSVDDFKLQLDNLLNLNGFETIIDKNDPRQIVIQFAINNECNKIYDVSVDINGNCRKLYRGFDAFLNKESVSDPTTVNFVKNIERIYFVEVCKVPWYEFIETYVYPETEILEPTQEPNETNYEVFLRAYKAYVAFNKINAVNPLKTAEQIIEEQSKLLDFQSQLLVDKTFNLFYNTSIYQGDNFFNPINLQKTLTTFRRIANDVGIETSSPYYFAIQPQGDSGPYVYVEPPLGNDLLQDGWTVTDKQPNFQDPIYERYSVTPFIYVEINGEKKGYTLKRGKESSKSKNKTFNEIMTKIYKDINKVGICKITDFAFECLQFSLRSLLANVPEVNIDTTLTFGVLKNYKYDELMYEILPYLPNEQQQFVYEEMLLNLSCVNKSALLYVLKTNLSQEEYTSLNLENASYEDIVKETSKRMVGTINE